jgi:hypothetical protein
MPSRFGGWLQANFGTCYIAYEVNAQDPNRHLTLSQLKGTGSLFALGFGDFMGSADGEQLRGIVDTARSDRNTRRQGNPATQPAQNAIESEAITAPAPAGSATLQFKAAPAGGL